MQGSAEQSKLVTVFNEAVLKLTVRAQQEGFPPSERWSLEVLDADQLPIYNSDILADDPSSDAVTFSWNMSLDESKFVSGPSTLILRAEGGYEIKERFDWLQTFLD